jgi:cell filamentation protein
MPTKKSIRFFNDFEVRAVWDEVNSKWWFSATDIVRAINGEEDYKKCRNYWKYLNSDMDKEGTQLVSVTNHFKEGKYYEKDN